MKFSIRRRTNEDINELDLRRYLLLLFNYDYLELAVAEFNKQAIRERVFVMTGEFEDTIRGILITLSLWLKIGTDEVTH